jgi:hypothetical protein
MAYLRRNRVFLFFRILAKDFEYIILARKIQITKVIGGTKIVITQQVKG